MRVWELWKRVRLGVRRVRIMCYLFCIVVVYCFLELDHNQLAYGCHDPHAEAAIAGVRTQGIPRGGAVGDNYSS
jgi:hypothetical protein